MRCGYCLGYITIVKHCLLSDASAVCFFSSAIVLIIVVYRCREEDKDAYLYYILRVHGQGRTIVFCTSISALRHISSLLRILGINVLTLHAQMQQRARLKVSFS